MFITSNAIVLNKVKHTDTNFIVTLYTEEEGSVAFSVRIPKTSRGNIKPTLFQPLNQLTVEWDHRNTQAIQKIRSVRILQPYATLLYEPLKATIVTFLAETLYHSLKEEHQGEIYPYIEHSLLWLDNAQNNYSNFHLVFLIKLTRFLGFNPNTTNYENGQYFDLINAVYTSTQPAHIYYINKVEAQNIPLFLKLNYANMHKMLLNRKQRQYILELIATYYRLHIPAFPKLKSLDILKDVFN